MSDRVRNLLAGLVSLAVFASVLTLALNADGREATQATSNDGGAWLVDRGRGGAAHVEFTTRQPTVSACLLYTSPSPRDRTRSRMPSSA